MIAPWIVKYGIWLRRDVTEPLRRRHGRRMDHAWRAPGAIPDRATRSLRRRLSVNPSFGLFGTIPWFVDADVPWRPVGSARDPICFLEPVHCTGN